MHSYFIHSVVGGGGQWWMHVSSSSVTGVWLLQGVRGKGKSPPPISAMKIIHYLSKFAVAEVFGAEFDETKGLEYVGNTQRATPTGNALEIVHFISIDNFTGYIRFPPLMRLAQYQTLRHDLYLTPICKIFSVAVVTIFRPELWWTAALPIQLNLTSTSVAILEFR